MGKAIIFVNTDTDNPKGRYPLTRGFSYKMGAAPEREPSLRSATRTVSPTPHA